MVRTSPFRFFLVVLPMVCRQQEAEAKTAESSREAEMLLQTHSRTDPNKKSGFATEVIGSDVRDSHQLNLGKYEVAVLNVVTRSGHCQEGCIGLLSGFLVRNVDRDVIAEGEERTDRAGNGHSYNVGWSSSRSIYGQRPALISTSYRLFIYTTSEKPRRLHFETQVTNIVVATFEDGANQLERPKGTHTLRTLRLFASNGEEIQIMTAVGFLVDGKSPKHQTIAVSPSDTRVVGESRKSNLENLARETTLWGGPTCHSNTGGSLHSSCSR